MAELKQKSELRKIFSDQGLKIPKIEIGNHYSWTTYTVKFATQHDYDTADKNGLFEKFKNQIKVFNKSQKIDQFVVPFDPGRAVLFTYVGQHLT